jgi:hypothetical protein
MTIKGIVAAVVVSSALTLGASMAAAPANAEATGTVKAQTQRTTAPSLNSQDGVYNVGDKLTLVCHTSGQAVKGFFSFNIPNGGWDNLWYQTSDGHYVPDVDIETGTLNALGPQCGQEGAAAPAPASDAAGKANAAVLKANSAVGTNMFGDLGCGRFVAWSYGVGGLGYNTAKEFRDHLASQGQIHPDQNFPRGALVFSESSWDKGNGHVDIAQGDGTFVSGGVFTGYQGLAGAGHNVQVMNTWNPSPGATFLGWAVAPW